MPKKIVIIGANCAGSTAASAARKIDRNADIILVEAEKYPAYSRCGIPYVLSGKIKSFEDLIVFPLDWYKMMNIDLRLETIGKMIDSSQRTVTIEKDGNEEALSYDALIFATGGRSFIPPFKGADKKGVYSLRTIEDGRLLQETMKDVKSAVVVGTSSIGLEMANALVSNKINTTVLEMLPQVCPATLDWDMANLVSNKLQEHCENVIVGAMIKDIFGNGKVRGLSINTMDMGKKLIETEMVVMATGVRTRTELARKIGVEIGVTSGIKTNADMSTNVQDIYACGDCVETISLIDKQPVRDQLGTTAARQAKVAGTNAAGGNSTFPGVLGSTITKIFDFEVGSTGYSESQAARLGYKTVTGSITSRTKAEYFPGGEEIKVKLVVERDLGRVIGGQIIAAERVAQRINMLATAIQMQMTAQTLAKADTCYAPPVNVTIEPVSLAAELAISRLSTRSLGG